MTVSLLFLAGRIVLAVPIVLYGVDRIVDDRAPGGDRLWAALAVVGTAGVVVGVWGDAAALVLGVAALGAAVAGRADERMAAVGLLGAAVVVAALYTAVGTALDWTVTGPVFDLDLR